MFTIMNNLSTLLLSMNAHNLQPSSPVAGRSMVIINGIKSQTEFDTGLHPAPSGDKWSPY